MIMFSSFYYQFFLTKPLPSVVFLLLTFLSNSLYSVFLATSFFTVSLSLFKSTGVVSNFPISNLSTLLFKLLKPLGIFFNLSISYLSTSDFKLAKLVYLAQDDASTPVRFFKSAFVV